MNTLIQKMKIRKASNLDFNPIAELIRSAIVRLNKVDYSDKQVLLWSNNFRSSDKLVQQSTEHTFYVCVNKNNAIAGVFTLNKKGFIHYFFVHPDYTGQGVAQFMYEYIENEINPTQIEVHASETILPFFLKHGFELVKEQFPTIEGVAFKNYHLQKNVNA